MRVAVVGGGTMGLAAAWALARRGARVEVFERHGHVHELGSHGGHTRIIRHAYHEGSDYVGLVSRADREWTALGERVGETLLVRCGLLEFGAPDDPEFAATLAALDEHGVEHQRLSATTARARYPFEIPPGWDACLSPGSGYLRVRACLDALRDEAQAAGATLHYGVGVRELELGGARVGLRLEDGRQIQADHLVIAAGAWAARLLPIAARVQPLTILRRVLAWSDACLRELPAWGAFTPEGFFYGFPANDEGAREPQAEALRGCKLACHQARAGAEGITADLVAHMDAAQRSPESVAREVDERDLAPLRAFIARYFPAAGQLRASKTCLYTQTASGDFWIEPHPEDPRVSIAAGFSGHGFKFAPAVGLAVAALAIDGHSELCLPRFGASPG
nr:N-methyl-L-tryptophan oxidase [Pseudenhygromyxa sp. WMMC2535]